MVTLKQQQNFDSAVLGLVKFLCDLDALKCFARAFQLARQEDQLVVSDWYQCDSLEASR